MTRDEIIYTIQSAFEEVLRVEVPNTAEPDMVFIWVTVDVTMAPDDIYDLKARIGMYLEPRRPAGVGYEVVVKQSGESFTNATSRWAAIAAELTVEVSPLKKPLPSPVPKLYAPRLFEQVIEVKDGLPSPCPVCKCQAFTPDPNGGRCVCRGCPLPAPIYGIEPGVKTQQYKCGRCNKTSAVTMTMRQLNLYCDRCTILTIHDAQQTQVFRGAKATFKFNGVEVGLGSVEDIEFSADEVTTLAAARPVAPSGGSISFTLEQKADTPMDVAAFAAAVAGMKDSKQKTDWSTAIERMAQRVASEYGMPLAEMQTRTPAMNIAEMFRLKLELDPFDRYAADRVAKNAMQKGLKESDWIRRTGRTTRGMLLAIAEFIVRPDLRMLAVVGSNEQYTKTLMKDATTMVERLQLQRPVTVKPLMPDDFDERSDYTRSQRCWVFVDHSYDERRR